MEKTSGVATNVYLRKMLEKPKRQRSAYFENEGSRVVYARENEGPVEKSKRQRCARHDFKIFLFSLFFLYFPFLCFFIFLGLTRVLPLLLHILRCDEEI